MPSAESFFKTACNYSKLRLQDVNFTEVLRTLFHKKSTGRLRLLSAAVLFKYLFLCSVHQALKSQQLRNLVHQLIFKKLKIFKRVQKQSARGVLQKRCLFFKKEALTQVLYCEFCEISKITLFYRTSLVAASGTYVTEFSFSTPVTLFQKSLYPVDTGRKFNVHKTFRRRPGRLMNILCMLNLRPVSTGQM